MAFIRCCITTAVLSFCILYTQAQTVFYPQGSSQLLKSTAEDAAMLLQKAIRGSHITIQTYTSMPASGIILAYDSSVHDNQACKVTGDGVTYIKFSASQDNGLCYGIYQFLQSLGFRFYQPGSIWEIIPALNTAYKKIDSTFTSTYKYKTWFISGGHNRWIMDNNVAYSWDTYFGDNGHNWALYQRRNGMLGTYRFAGHRGDIMNTSYVAALQNNPCFVASYNGSRAASNRSVADIFNEGAVSLWANTIEQKYTQARNVIFANTTLYRNQYLNFNYSGSHLGIEVPDGANWGNSTSNNISCNGIAAYPKESDQHFILANKTAEKILAKYPGKRFQVYAYSTHADVPSSSVKVNNSIDVQIIPAVYQMETSTRGIRNRWYNRSANISEYHYLNLSGWSGETPSFSWKDLNTTLQTAKDKKSQGLVWEASPAKFASLPYLLAANNSLKDGTPVDITLKSFCNDMFADAGNTVFEMMKQWGDEKTVPNKHNMQLYLQLLNKAGLQTKDAGQLVKERIRELKAYLHYMVLYFDMAADDQVKKLKREKDAETCIYLARTNKLQLVNSYFLITNIVSRYPLTDDFYSRYNTVNGTAYQNGTLPLVTAEEIDSTFLQDFARYGNGIDQYQLKDAGYIQEQFAKAKLAPLDKIKASITYTNGINYYNKTGFNIIAPKAGNFVIEYSPRFDMPGKGYINFLVEAEDKTLEVITDFSIDQNSKAGSIKVNIPAAGQYILTISSKYKSGLDISITTNGNYFYKKGIFLGNKTESYVADAKSLPGYFFVPAGLSKIYFNTPNSFSSGKYASAEAIRKSYDIKDNNGNLLPLYSVTPKDSSLFYFSVAEQGGTFWQATKMGQYFLNFVNISNVLWYAGPKTCTDPDFKVSVISRQGKCITQLTATTSEKELEWQVIDIGSSLKFSNQSVVELPDYISTDALVTLTNNGHCSVTKRLSDAADYLRTKQNCTSAVSLPERRLAAGLYPNPSTGVFNCYQNGTLQTAASITITNSQGLGVADFKNVKQFNISNAPPGIYFYKMLVKGQEFTGRLVKL